MCVCVCLYVYIYTHMVNFKYSFVSISCRSQWPDGQRCRYVAASMLELWIRIPPGARMSVVSVVCFQVEVHAAG